MPFAGHRPRRSSGHGDHRPRGRPRPPRHRRAGRTDARPAPGRRPTASCAPGRSTSAAAGTILVVGSRVDAETLTRARAMGVRGVIVTGLSSKERRDYLASEARQRSALHRLPPFAVLVLEGAVRRPLAGGVLTVLTSLVGHEVAIVADPPMLVFDVPNLQIPAPPVDLVRIRGGSLAGREGRFVEAIGPRRFARRGASRGRPGPLPRRLGRGGAAGRPGAVRLTRTPAGRARRRARPAGRPAFGYARRRCPP